MPLPSLEQENDLPMSLSQDLASHTSSPMEVTDDILVPFEPPAPFNNSSEFEVGEDLESRRDLDLNIKSNIKHHEIDESEETILQETWADVIEPTKLKFNDTILSVKYESFSYGFNDNESFDEGFCVDESFSFDPIITDLLFESYKSELVESDNLVIENSNLDSFAF